MRTESLWLAGGDLVSSSLSFFITGKKKKKEVAWN